MSERDVRSQAPGTPGTPPVVSVVVPVWNVAPYLRQCLDSVLQQSIGQERMEVIAVDDGSTDSSGAILDEYAARLACITVLHEPNSGGPGRPRNLGMDRGTGTYVFFLDADDYLGPEALERLVAMAERNQSDIVLARRVGIHGRRIDPDAGPYRQTADRLPLELANLSGNVHKLFRRSFLQRSGLRFEEGIAGGEDGDFMAALYPLAGTISVVADYDCYYLRRRPGSQTTRTDRHDDLVEYLTRIERERIRPAAEARRSGPGRDALVVRHFKKVARLFGAEWLAREPAERRRIFEVGSRIVQRWNTPLIQWLLPSRAALRVYCLEHGLLRELEDVAAARPRDVYASPVVEGRRIYARYPHFRDSSRIPDRCFDITRHVRIQQSVERAAVRDGKLSVAGTAFLRRLGGRTWISLRRVPGGRPLQFPTVSTTTPQLRDGTSKYPRAGFSAEIDLARADGGRPLRAGTWAVRLAVAAHGVRRTTAVRVNRAVPAGVVLRSRSRRRPQPTLRVTAARELRLDVGVPSRAALAYDAMASMIQRGMRRVLEGMVATRPGRYLVIAVELLRPDLAAGLLKD